MQRDTGLTIQEFFDAACETLELKVHQGKQHMERSIPEASLNRPGLALAGFVQYFANKRLQVIGLAELTYLKSLTPNDRVDRVRRFVSKRIPGIVVTRNRQVPVEILVSARKAHVPVMTTKMITMDFINAATLIMEDLASPRKNVHGTMVDIQGIGVLIQGDPGIGKSETALALIERGHSLVADDLTVLRRDRSGLIIGSSVEITRYHMEIRGLGIIHVPSIFGVASMRVRMKLDLIVHMHKENEAQNLDRTGLTPETQDVLGIDIPLVRLPVAAGRDLSLIVEAAALNQKLKLFGHDAAKELDEKLIEVMTRRAKVRR